MAESCTFDDLGLVKGLLASVDCNVSGVVKGGYAVLADPSGSAALILTSLLTLYIAFMGFRLLTGRGGLNVGETTTAAIKIGIVLALATSWGAYQTVVYSSLYAGPTQIATSLLSAVQPSDSAFAGDPMEGLQVAFDEIQQSAAAYAGRAGAASPLVGGVAFGAMALNASSFLLLLSTLGLLLVSKIVLAMLLALAPVVAGLLLFDATRGMVEGWLKSMVGLALVPLSVTLMLAIELTMIEPGLALLAQERDGGTFGIEPVMNIAMLSLVFAGVIVAACIAGFVIAKGLRLPGRSVATAAEAPAAATASAASAERGAAETFAMSRAARIAAAAETSARRDARDAGSAAAAVDRRTTVVAADRGTRAPEGGTHVPLGQSFRRPVQPRRSAASNRRDR